MLRMQFCHPTEKLQRSEMNAIPLSHFLFLLKDCKRIYLVLMMTPLSVLSKDLNRQVI